MKLTKKIQKALNLAAAKHNGQMRKSSKLPYIVHPFSVAIILSEFTDDENVIVAGLLHDLLEDVESYSYQNLKNDFGQKIADIILGISEENDFDNGESEKETWKKRKLGYLKNLEKQNQESLLICAADKIHNLKSMSRIYQEQKRGMWRDFNAPLEKQIWYYQAVIEILEIKLRNRQILKKLKREFDFFKKNIKQI
jgi:(p)ppGpp synthase/HD superfamily hydrolase